MHKVPCLLDIMSSGPISSCILLVLELCEWNHTEFIVLCLMSLNAVFVRFIHICIGVIYSLVFLYSIL